MADPDRFAGIAAALASADAAREESGSGSSASVANATGHDESLDPAAIQSPAFPFDEAEARSIYVRRETLEAVDDIEALVDARLRTERNVRNLTTREFFEALLTVAIDDPDGILDAVVEHRRVSIQR